ncbi:MAG: lipoate--protein ligase family protein [Candidatus Altiarchaeales archaeon]|nr:lipoate--protein ligase family protein [Candidatus Altiarchaeales archaeon]
MAQDQLMLDKVSQDQVPVLRIYGWSPPAVSIGYFQSLRDEVDETICRKKGVDIVRRMTGGGAVYHKTEATYSLILPQKTMNCDIQKSYEKINQGVVEALRLLGVESRFRPLNDITVGGKKISGNAQTRRGRCILQHGTILLDVDPREMFTILKVDSEKQRDKAIKNVLQYVTSVRDELGCEVSYEEMSDALRRGFREALELNYCEKPLTGGEQAAAQKISEDKFSKDEWNYRR